MNFGTTEIVTVIVVLSAYFVKGFSGFGPALILVPALTPLYGPETAISASTYFDLIAGLILLSTVRKEIDWKFVIPVTLLVITGAYFGAKLLKVMPVEILIKTIGISLLFFIIILLWQNKENGKVQTSSAKHRIISLPIAFLAGFSGGIVGITGPLLIIYMKLNFEKSYFRTQLIAIFMLAALGRFFLYYMNEIDFNLERSTLLYLTVVLIIGLWLGQHLHHQVNEKNFNRIIAIILLLPTLNLLIFQ